MGVRITSGQRDAVYDMVLDRLSGIGDVWVAVCSEDFDHAQRLGREYFDELRLVLDDLGWGDGPPGAEIKLTTDPDVLQRVFGRLRRTRAAERGALIADSGAGMVLEERGRLVDEAADRVLQGPGEAG